MKIALIRRQFSAAGGAELYVSRLIQELHGKNHQVHLFAEQWAGNLGCTLHPVPRCHSRAERSVHFAREVQRLVSIDSFDCVFSLERTLRQDVYRAGDGVHFNWLRQQRRFAPLWRKPFVGVSRFHRRLLRLESETISPQNSRRIIVNSDMVGREIRARFDYPAERIHLVRNGIDFSRFNGASKRRGPAREHWGLDQEDFVLLFVGSGWERKGLRFVLNAVDARPDGRLKLLVAGKGKGHWPRSPRVNYLGAIAEVELAFAAADLFISLTIYDPSANACFEAMAAGLPVITTQFDGASELIQSGRNGSVIADPRDTGTVIDAIEYWRNKGAPEWLAPPQQISLERNVAETVSVLEQAARERSR